MSIQANVIKSCWLAGLTREDCAALIIAIRLKSNGIVMERAVYQAIDAVYDTLTLLTKPLDTYECDPIRFIADSQKLDRRNSHA